MISKREQNIKNLGLGFKGHKHSEDNKKKWSIERKGRKHTNISKEKMSKSRIEKKLWDKEKNPRWKGGITPIYQKIRDADEYKIWRNLIFKRDNYTCQKCRRYGGNLEVHHIIPLHKILEIYKIDSLDKAKLNSIVYDIDNGITLCIECHKEGDIYRR